MKTKLYLGMLLLGVALLIGCAPKGDYVDMEYTLPTETQAQVQQNINLEDYRIQEGAMIAIGDLIKVSGFTLESVCFYDNDNLMTLFLNADKTRLDAYMFSLEKSTLSWVGTIENLPQIEGIGNSYSVVSLNPLAIMDEYTNNIWVIKDKAIQQTISLDMNNVFSVAVGNNKAYYTHIGNNSIESIDFNSGQIETIYSDLKDYAVDINEITEVSDDGKYLYVTGIDKLTLKEITCVIDLDTKKMVAEVLGQYECWESDNHMYSSYLSEQKYVVHQREGDNNYTDVVVGEIMPVDHFDYFIPHEDIAITEENTNGIYTFTYYDIVNMKRLQSTNIDIHSYFMYQNSAACNYSYCAISRDFGYNENRNMLVYMVRTDEGYSNVFLWDIESAEKAGASLPGENYSEDMDFQYVNETDYDDLTDLVHIMYDDYGIGIYMGNNVPENFKDFSAGSMEDLTIIADALDSVCEVLEYYPDGFFDCFTEDGYLSGVNIYLTGDILSTTEGYMDNPLGFANIDSGYEVIAVDINYQDKVKETLVHEISHAIFERIRYEEVNTGNKYFDIDKWNELNPSEFEYYNAYVDDAGMDVTLNENGSYTSEAFASGGNLDDVYFVSDYSKTYITEDLALLMQYGMINNDEAFMASKKISSKLKFYYSAIRAVWNSAEWPETTYWEGNVR